MATYSTTFSDFCVCLKDHMMSIKIKRREGGEIRRGWIRRWEEEREGEKEQKEEYWVEE